MDSLHFLCRRFRDITKHPQGAAQLRNSQLRHLRVWLRDDVLPRIHELAKRDSFQSLASWPLDRLVNRSDTPEKLLLNQVDALLVKAANLLLVPLKTEALRASLGAKVMNKRTLEMITVGGGGQSDSPKESEGDFVVFDRIVEQTNQVEPIARRFWQSLVSEIDYFEPRAGWLTDRPTKRQPGELIMLLNPELHQGGDFVSRCAIHRVEVLTSILSEAISFISQARVPPENLPTEWGQATEVFAEVCKRSKLLRHALLEEKGQPLRDGCILLTQVGAAAGVNFDLTWLAVPEWTYQHLLGMKYLLFQQEKMEVFDRIADALSCLRDYYAAQEKRDLDWDEAKSTKRLAVNLPLRELRWNGNLVQIEWKKHSKAFLLLVRLAEAAKRSAFVDDRDEELYPSRVAPSTLPTLKNRLQNLLPTDLAELIEPTGEPRSFRLDLTRSDITVVR